jgi:DNA mismatch endonuclease (patch repair protein)
MDNLSRKIRSKVMRAIKSSNTKPEIFVRRLVYSLGYRYRICDTRLPGRPDLVFRPRKKVIFVHGCFWHVHKGCPLSHVPKYKFWRAKLWGNVRRDQVAIRALKHAGWACLVLWECELEKVGTIRRRIQAFLGPLLS